MWIVWSKLVGLFLLSIYLSPFSRWRWATTTVCVLDHDDAHVFVRYLVLLFCRYSLPLFDIIVVIYLPGHLSIPWKRREEYGERFFKARSTTGG